MLYVFCLVYDENAGNNDPVVLTWKDVISGSQSRSTPSDQNSDHADLNVLESLLNFQNVNVQVGGTTQQKPKEKPKEKPTENSTKQPLFSNSTKTQLIPGSQSSRVWPSSASASKADTFDLESVENAIRLKAQVIGTEELLYKTLLDPRVYEKDVRPTYHHAIATNVTFGFLLNQIVEMDERNQKLTTHHRLSWNATHWDNIKQLYIPHNKIWRPDIMLINNAVREYFSSLMSTDVMVTHEGNVTWLFSALFKSNCAIRVRDFPFDMQTCNLNFASWSHSIQEIDVLINTEKGDLSSYMNNSEFDLIDMQARRTLVKFPAADNTTYWPMIVIQIRMNRRPLFYAFNHILPCILITLMALLGFFMPPETGEKINMLTTVLDYRMYYLASLFIVCLATAVNVVTLKIHRFGSSNQGRSVPYWLEKIVLGYLASMLCMTIYESDSVTLLKTSQSRLSTLRRSSLMRDLKKSKNLEYRNATNEKRMCECLTASPSVCSHFKTRSNFNFQQTRHPRTSEFEMELLNEKIPKTGENAFLTKLLKDQILPRIQKGQTKPAMMASAEFEERFKRILKRIYRSLQQSEIREEILDERRRIASQWHNLANVLDRLLLLIFMLATLLVISAFLLPGSREFEDLNT
ncbi:hypothetical protein M3Y97_00245800 [Aphelenchoides bicaudatus]|nr:hypothetical protein M3Y97_00245800 [Aphelenchoides bicaudatus]